MRKVWTFLFLVGFVALFVKPSYVSAAEQVCPDGWAKIRTYLEDYCTDPKYANKCCRARGIGDIPALGYAWVCINVNDHNNPPSPINRCNEVDGNADIKDLASIGVSEWNTNFTVSCPSGRTGVNTAIGCIETDDLEQTIKFVLNWVMGISGGVILLLLIVTGYNLLTSSGNPEKLQGVRENIVSIFSGLILIGFSLVLLKVIGANVLLLPGF